MNVMDDIEEMSNKISDLNNENIQNLSENIQKELDQGNGDNYMNNNTDDNYLNSNLDELQQLQLKQLQELQKIQETQLMQQTDSDDLSESEEKDVKKKKSKKESKGDSMLTTIQKLLQEPLTLLLLYVFLSHNYVLTNIAKFVPSMVSEDEVTIKNLFVRGIFLISIYFAMKMFMFK